MNTERPPGELSLLGGPLHRIASRLGLVRGGINTIPLGLALGVVPWLLIVALALLEGGAARQFFSLALIGGHLRLLAVIPLFFLCESLLDPKVTKFASTLVESGVIPSDARSTFQRQIDRTNRWRSSWLPEAVCLVAALSLPWLAPALKIVDTTAVFDPERAVAAGTWASRMYWLVALPLFRFLLFRWIFRLGLWWHFLWRVSRLKLHLVPIHPDLSAGLGFLEVVQEAFFPLVAAISVQQAGSLAEAIATGKVAFGELYPRLALLLLVSGALMAGPFLLFSVKLYTCKVQGLKDYMELASRYVGGFDRKWLGGDSQGETLLGTADIQSLADLANSVNLIRHLRWAPTSAGLLTTLVLSALLPMAPLLLFKYPLADLLQKLFSNLAGL